MSADSGPNIVTSGLTLCLDATNPKSFKGEPTTNLSYNNGQGNSQHLSSLMWWVNAGSATYYENDTSISKPYIEAFDTTNLWIQSAINTTTNGSVHFGCGFTYVSASTTYTISVYFRQNIAGTNQPYLRTNNTNISLGNLAYNGDTNASNWPVNQWIRISATATTPGGENGIYISNYIGTNIGDKIWYFGHQVEQKTHMTSLVAGERGATVGTGGGIADLSGNAKHHTLIDSPNEYFNPRIVTLDGTSQGFTYGSAITTSSTCTVVLIYKTSDGTELWVRGNQNNSWYLSASSGNNYYHSNCGSPENYVDLNRVYNPVTEGYRNGEYHMWEAKNVDFSAWTYFEWFTYCCGWQLSGSVALILVYNRVLSAAESLQNFNALKYRFGNIGSSPMNPAPSASAILSANPSAQSGSYWLKPDGGSGVPFKAYCIMTRDGGGWVKVAQYNSATDLNTTSAVNGNSTWVNSEISLYAGKISTADWTALNKTNSFLFRVTGGADNLLNNGSGTGKLEYSGSLPAFGTLLDPTLPYKLSLDMTSDGTYEFSANYTNDSRGLCAYIADIWICDHNYNGSFVSAPPYASIPICWDISTTQVSTNLHWMSGLAGASAGNVRWGDSGSTSFAIYVK